MEHKSTGLKDCAGREIFEGDNVATTHECYTWSLAVTEVVGCTAKQIKLAVCVKPIPRGTTYAIAPEAYEIILKYPEQTCLVR